MLTTPGATRFYRSASDTALQRQNLHVGVDATLEWLPQETILFSGSKVEMTTTIYLKETARFIGWDMTCLGRPTSGDNYTTGSFNQQYRIWRGAEPLLIERNRYLPGQGLLRAHWGLAENTVVATLYALPTTASLLKMVRDSLLPRAGVRFSSTCLNDVLVFRCLARNAEQCRELLVQVWTLLREPVVRRSVCAPRIWYT